MEKTPKGLRLHIGLFGRTNVGKSSFLNMVAGQDVSIISDLPGTTTDVVEKTMELLPVGPVVFLDTAGIDDKSALSDLRIRKSLKVFDRADTVVLLTEPNVWGEYEDFIITEAGKRKLPFMIVVNKIDLAPASEEFLSGLRKKTARVFSCSCSNRAKRDDYVNALKKILLEMFPEHTKQMSLLSGLVPSGGIAVLVVPIDLEAPKGRLILPQVQTIRDALDNDAAVLVVKETGYRAALSQLKSLPAIAVCDSQAVLQTSRETPEGVKLTTFSILLSRYKGDLVEMAKGAAAIKKLKGADKVLVAEACSHHAIEDDIARVKMPRWFRQYVGADVQLDVVSGKDYPDRLDKYKLIVHCGACMINRSEMLSRIRLARAAGIPITNYGICISFLQGVAQQVLAPFPDALNAMLQEMEKGGS